MSGEVPIKLRYFMLNHFEKGWTPEQSYADLTETYGEDVISKDSVDQWFSRFQSGDKNVEDEQESESDSDSESGDQLETLKEKLRYTTGMLADVTGTSQATINRNLKQFETKQPNLPKRAMSAFFIWMQENRERLKKPGMSVADVAKAAGKEWGKLKDKTPWETAAQKERERYEQEVCAYRKNKC